MTNQYLEQDAVPPPLETDQSARVWAMAAHLASLTGYLRNEIGTTIRFIK